MHILYSTTQCLKLFELNYNVYLMLATHKYNHELVCA